MTAKLFTIDLVGFEFKSNHGTASRPPLPGEGKESWFPGVDAPTSVKVQSCLIPGALCRPKPRNSRLSLLFPFQRKKRSVANSPATWLANMLSFQLNIALASPSFASLPGSHNTFFLIVGFTTVPRISLPSFLDRESRGSLVLRTALGGLHTFLPALLHQNSELNNLGFQDWRELWEKTLLHLPPKAFPSLWAAHHDIPLFIVLTEWTVVSGVCLMNLSFLKFFLLLPHHPYLGQLPRLTQRP